MTLKVAPSKKGKSKTGVDSDTRGETQLVGSREVVRRIIFALRMHNRALAAEKEGQLVPVAPQVPTFTQGGVYPSVMQVEIKPTKVEEGDEESGAGIDLGGSDFGAGGGGIGGAGKMSKEWEELSKVEHGDTYPLLYSSDGMNAIAYAQISWDEQEQALIYRVIEPQLYPGEKEQLKKLEQKLEEKLEVDLAHVGTSSQEYLRSQLDRVLDIFGLKLDDDKKMRFEYYIFRDFIGLNQIEPLMHDPNIEDVSCDGINIPLYVQHRNPEYGSLATNIMFASKEELDSFAIKLAQRCNKAISVASPLLDGILPDGSRVQTTLGSDIARRGSNFTIRKFSEHPFTPLDLIRFKTLPPKALAYLWMMIENGKSCLIAGATATGKTSFLNAVSLFIKPEAKIVSIEDTGELQLPHPNWIPQVSRSGIGEKSYGAVEMYDLLKAALRQRPDYVIVGEVRGAEANVMFQGMATGHPAMGTIHADTVQKVMDRLVTPPISLSAALLENLDLIIFLARTKIHGRYVRRVSSIVEIRKVDIKEQRMITNSVIEWDPAADEIAPKKPSIQLKKIAQFRGISEASVVEELNRRSKIIEWLNAQDIRDYATFADYIKLYYSNPQKLVSIMREHFDKDLKPSLDTIGEPSKPLEIEEHIEPVQKAE